MEDDKNITVAKYKRCSTNRQELTNQNEKLDKTIERMKQDNPSVNYYILDFEDEAISGKSKDRPGLNKLLDKVRKKKIDMVIFTKLDRLGRSLQDLLSIVTELENHNVTFKSVEQDIDTRSPQGRLLFQVMGAFAEFERNIINERLQAGKESAKHKGTKSGNPMHRPKMKIDEDGVVYKFNNGMSMHQIAKSYGVSITPVRRILKDRELV